jgi:hypothetical protein
MTNNVQSTTAEEVQEEQIEEIISPNVKKDEEEAKLQQGITKEGHERKEKEESEVNGKKQEMKEEANKEKKEEKTEVKEEKKEEGLTKEEKTEEKGEEEKGEKEEKPKKDYAPLLAKALEFKQEGNKLFNDKNYSEAVDQYAQAIHVMDGGHAEYPQECSIFFGNRAACYAALGNPPNP